MTFAYQPSAAGISWLSMCENAVSRMEMEQNLLDLSATSTKVQSELTLTNSTQTFNELNDEAQGIKASAWYSIMGAAGGIATSCVSLGLVLKNTPSSPEAEGLQNMTVEQKAAQEENNEIEMQDLSNIQQKESAQDSAEIVAKGAAQKDAVPNTSNPGSNVAAEEKMTPAQARQAAWSKYFQDHGSYIASFVNSGVGAIGTSQQAKYKGEQAQAKELEVIAQGIASVMNSLGQMLASAISGCDTFFNNTEGNLTTIIQVSAVRG